MVNNIYRIKFRGPISLMVPIWSGVAFHMMGGLIFIFLTGFRNSFMYVGDILLNYVVPYILFVGAGSFI